MTDLTNRAIAEAAGYKARSIRNADGDICWALFTPNDVQIIDLRMGGLVTNEDAAWSYFAPDFLHDANAALALVDGLRVSIKNYSAVTQQVYGNGGWWCAVEDTNPFTGETLAIAICRAFMAYKHKEG